ncbi:MAG: M56 family metallopeptidase [Verrucomicrobiota bacterium]
MNAFFEPFVEWLGPFPAFLVWLPEASWKGGLVAILGGLISLFWFRRAAVDRFRIWLAVLATFALLPFLGLVSPQWVFPVSVLENAGPVESLSPIPVPNRGSVAPTLTEPSFPAVPVSKPEIRRPGWFHLWGLGLAVVWIRLGIGSLALAWVRRRARGQWSESCQVLQHRCDALSRTFGLRRRVEVLVSLHRQMPMTWGWWRPRLLLPADAADWDQARVDAVLSHELAHIRRNDGLAQILGQVVLGIYWFHPLVWLALRRMTVERERACDDLVLEHGTKASDYAAQLMGVSTGRELAGRYHACAIAMARPNQLENRLRRVLDSSCSRQGLKKQGIRCFLGGMALVLLPLALMRLSAEEAPEEPSGEGNAEAEVDGSEEDDRLVTEMYAVSPSLARAMKREGENADAVAFFQKKGILFPDGASAFFNESESQLILRNTRHQLEMIEAMNERWLAGESVFGEASESPLSEVLNDPQLKAVLDESRAAAGITSRFVQVDDAGEEERPDDPSPPRVAQPAPATVPSEPVTPSRGIRQWNTSRGDGIRRLIDDTEAELKVMESRYLENHPRIKDLQARIKVLESRLAAESNVVQVATAMPGIVRKVSVKRGDKVEAGTLLIELDSRRASLALDAAREKESLARKNLERMVEFHEIGKITMTQVDQAEAETVAARTAVVAARFDLEDCRIVAPRAGVVLSVEVNPGEYASPEKPVVRLQPQENDAP